MHRNASGAIAEFDSPSSLAAGEGAQRFGQERHDTRQFDAARVDGRTVPDPAPIVEEQVAAFSNSTSVVLV